MKRFVILTLILMALAGCASKGASGSRSNSSDLQKSPCAGCFGDEEKQEIGVKVSHVS